MTKKLQEQLNKSFARALALLDENRTVTMDGVKYKLSKDQRLIKVRAK